MTKGHEGTLGLFEFLDGLEAQRMSFTLARYRNSIMVVVSLPGQRWEVEYFVDGHVEVEKFISDGTIETASQLDALFEEWGRDEGPPGGQSAHDRSSGRSTGSPTGSS